MQDFLSEGSRPALVVAPDALGGLSPVEQRAVNSMLRLITKAPGPSLRDLLAAVETGEIRTQALLRCLLREGAIVEGRALGARRFYPRSFSDSEAQQHAAVLRDAEAARIYALLLNTTCCQRDLIRKMEDAGWSRRQTLWRLQTLHQHGLVRRCGGTARFPAWRSKSAHPHVMASLRYVQDD